MTTQSPRVPSYSLAASVSVPARVDHIILGIDTLERGIAKLREATGLIAAFGGIHPGRGTQNAVIALGPDRYLELLAPNPHDSTAAARIAEFSRYRDLTPIGWAMRTENADSLNSVLVSRGVAGGIVRAGSRQRPDGATLRWRTVDPWGGRSDLLLPFFIQWAPSGPHPSADAPLGCTLVGLTFASPSADSIRALLGHADVHVSVVRASQEILGVTLDCPSGRLQFPARAP